MSRGQAPNPGRWPLSVQLPVQHLLSSSVKDLLRRFRRSCSHQGRLVGALRGPVEDDVVFHQHGHGSQDEGDEEVQVDVVPGAVKLPAPTFQTEAF